MRPLRSTAALLACAAVLAAAGCGSKKDEGDPIPRDVASAMSQELTSVQNRVDYAKQNLDRAGEGACNDIDKRSFPTLGRLLERVPDGVSQDVRDGLSQSVDRLHQLTRSVCEDVRRKADETDTTPTEPTPTEPLPPETQTLPPPETTPTTPTTPEQNKPNKPKQPKPKPPGQGDQPGNSGTGGASPGDGDG